jgi:hypothetical protein
MFPHRSRGLLLLPMALAWSMGGLAEDASPTDPPAQVPAPKKEEPAPPPMRQQLETLAKAQGWALTFKEDDTFLLATTGDAKLLDEVRDTCEQSLNRFCQVFEISRETLRGKGKFWFLLLVTRADYNNLGKAQAKQHDDPSQVQRYEKTAAVGCIVCSDPLTGTGPSTQNMVVHLLAHRMLEHYAALHPGGKVPGWILEGFAAYLDAYVKEGPRVSCLANVGYEGKELKERGQKGNWAATVRLVVQKYQEKLKKKEVMETYRGLANLTARQFDKLSGQEVAVSWQVTTDLVGTRPQKYKVFLDGVLDGTKQQEAFKAAFGKDIDDYERSWMKAVLKEDPLESKVKPRQ